MTTHARGSARDTCRRVVCLGAAALAACTVAKVGVTPPVTTAPPRPLPDAAALVATLPLVPRPRLVVPCEAAPPVESEPGETVEHSGAPDDESYVLDVAGDRSWIRAATPAGLVRAKTTLSAIRSATPSPCLHVEDRPHARLRGMHLDVARHFFSKEVVERYLDLLAFYKFNLFHLHLSDDQGFRLALDKHPELVRAGGRDGFYTPDDVREIVAFAAERGITVVPEIDVPGHARAILAAHPELSCRGKPLAVPRSWGIFEDVLCAGNDATFELLGDVLDEIVALFPGPYVHVGGDEVPTKRWSECPKCAARMHAEHLGVDRLEGWFMQRVTRMVEERGRRAMVWDEALDPRLPKDVVVVAWQSAERGELAAAAGHDVLMAPHTAVYFNIKQSRSGAEPGHPGYLPWERVRAFDPGGSRRIRGGEGALWTEHVTTVDDIDTLIAPRIAALADALWSGPEAEGDFVARFTAQRPLLDERKIRYFVDPPEGWRKRTVFLGESTTVTLAPPRLFPDGVVRYTTNGQAPTESSTAVTGPIEIRETTRLSVAVFLPGGRTSPVVQELVDKQRPRPAASVPPPPGVTYKYYEGDFYLLPDFSRLTPTSEGTAPGFALLDSFRPERFAASFEGRIEAPKSGVYRFVARADDGVRVLVDGELVAEDDGEHESRETDGEIALEAGFHRMRVLYFQGTGGKELSVGFSPLEL